jgi:uncharacterized RDD family membrane protein YckC
MANSAEILNIETPENVAFGYEVAGIGSRFVATLIDTVLLLVVQVIQFLAFAFIGSVVDSAGVGVGENAIIAIYAVVSFIGFWGYYILFETLWNGQTPGKRVAKLRVLRGDGTPIALTEAIIRNLVRLIDFLPIFYGVGVVAMFVDRQSRRLGDMAANTLVVYDRTAVSLASLDAPGRVTPSDSALRSAAALGLPTERLTEADIVLLENLLARRNELANYDVHAQRVLQRLFRQMDVPFSADVMRHSAVYSARILTAARHPEAVARWAAINAEIEAQAASVPVEAPAVAHERPATDPPEQISDASDVIDGAA